MEPMQIALIIVVGCVAAIVGTAYGISYAKKKGVDVGNGIKTADTLTDAISNAFDTIKPLLPAHPAIGIIDSILSIAEVGVNAAEKLYKTATIDKDQRKTEATEFVVAALKAAGIEVTDEIRRVIDGAVTGAVALLPKTHDETGTIANQ